MKPLSKLLTYQWSKLSFPHAISIKIFDLSTLYTTTPHSCQHGDILHNTLKQIYI